MFMKLRAWWFRFSGKGKYLKGVKLAEEAIQGKYLQDVLSEVDYDIYEREEAKGILDYWDHYRKSGIF